MEKIQVPFETKSLIETDSENYILTGLASTFGNIDLVNDVVMPGAFKESLVERAPKILWQHQGWEPVGIAEVGENSTRETSEGLMLKALLPKADTFVSGRAIPQIKVGSIDSLSIGFRAIEWSCDEKSGIRLLQKVDLREVSLVTFPVNEQALITGVKAVTPFRELPMSSRSRSWDGSAARKRIKEFTGSDEKPSSGYKSAFMWYDSSNSDNFGAYKLPFVDIIDGKMTVVPRALFAIKSVLSGGRGGVNIPESDRTKVKTVLDKYLAKLEGNKAYDSLDILEIKSKADFNDLLKSLGCFTKDAREKLSSQFVPRQGNPVDGKRSNSEKLIQDIKSITQELKNR
jgi:HK97 family phage prohead protease